jgi:hypothetical protein
MLGAVEIEARGAEAAGLDVGHLDLAAVADDDAGGGAAGLATRADEIESLDADVRCTVENEGFGRAAVNAGASLAERTEDDRRLLRAARLSADGEASLEGLAAFEQDAVAGFELRLVDAVNGPPWGGFRARGFVVAIGADMVVRARCTQTNRGRENERTERAPCCCSQCARPHRQPGRRHPVEGTVTCALLDANAAHG